MLSLERTMESVRARVGPVAPDVALILGSGLSDLAHAIEDSHEIEYADLPGFPVSTVSGHAGRFVFGRLEGREVVAMQGRIHVYEGYPPETVVFPARLMLSLGAETLIVTNAAGGVNPDFEVGDIMLISDHINFTGCNPLVGINDPALGDRFPDMSRAYDEGLRGAARAVASELGVGIQEGVYAGVLGPSYETPAEVRMLRTVGADAVGMSTVVEVIAAVHMGARVLGVSAISNPAAGLSTMPLRHEDVKAAVNQACETLATLVRGVIRRTT